MMLGDGEIVHTPISAKAENVDFWTSIFKRVFQGLTFVLLLNAIVKRLKDFSDTRRKINSSTMRTEENYFVSDTNTLLSFLRDSFDVTAEIKHMCFTKEKNPSSLDIMKYEYNPEEKVLTAISKQKDDELIEKIEYEIFDQQMSDRIWKDLSYNNKVIIKRRYKIQKRKNIIYLDEWVNEKFSILHLSSPGTSNRFERNILEEIFKLSCIQGTINVASKSLAYMTEDERLAHITPV
jgi:hypothetical protein